MVDITKLDMTDIWASGGDKIAPSPEKIAQGWLVEAVPRQTWNWFENRQDQNIAYLLQKGIPEWDATTEYLINKTYVQCNGVVYKCIATNTNNDPATATAYWSKAFVDSTAYLEKIKDLAVVNNTTSVINGSGVATNVPYGSVGLSLLAASTQAAGRTAIGAQQLNTHLTALAGLTSATNLLPYFNGVGTMATTAITAFGRALLDDADAAAGRATLDVPSVAALTSGLAGKQPLDTTLTALAGVTTANNTLIYATGADTFDTTPLTAFGRSLLDDVDSTAGRATLGLGSAATATVTTTATDQSAGRLLKVGDFGVGGQAASLPIATLNSNSCPSGIFRLDLAAEDNGLPAGVYSVTTASLNGTGVSIQRAVNYLNRLTYERTSVSGQWASVAYQSPTQSTTDSTTGRLLRVGDFGLGGSSVPLITDFSASITPGMYRAYGALNASASIGAPAESGNTALSVLVMRGVDGTSNFTSFLAVQHDNSSGSIWFGVKSVPGQPTWRQINQQVYGIGVTSAAGIPDANAITASGSYSMDSGTVNVPFTFGTLFCQVRSPTSQTQIAVSTTYDSLATRFKTPTGWSNWSFNYSRTNILGTVGQLSGVPTGAVIERGSNANGSYVKFADGTMICYLQAATSTFAASGGVFISNAVVSTLPATFVTAGDMVITGNDATNYTFWVTGLANNVSTITTVAWASALPSMTTRTLRLCVTGRWY